MAIVKALIGKDKAVSRLADGDEKDLRLSVDGSVVTMDWVQAMIQEGRGFCAKVGGFDSPATGGGQGAAIDLDQPEFCLDIPKGATVWPKRVHVTIVEGVLAADLNESEIVLSVDQDARINPGTPGTSTAGSIYNLNTLHSRSSMCVAQTLFSANTGSATADLELAHIQRILDIMTVGIGTHWHINRKGFELIYEPKTPSPMINGPAKLMCHWGGTVAALAYATFEWLELPS